MSVSTSTVALKTVVICWFKIFDSLIIGRKLSVSYSSILLACISSLNTKCIAVIFTLSFCFLTILLANRSKDLPFSLFPKNNNILNLLLLLISSGTNLYFDLNAQFIKFKAGPVMKVVTKAMITIIVKT